MANGYLGKISALVTANTSDFQAKLSGSAQSVRDFAGQVQRNLAGAARDSARAFESIYTPLQRFERSLQAAGSLKLSFKGFPGALKDLDALQQRMAGVLNDRQVAVILKTTGLDSIDRVRERLKDLTSKDLQIVASVGGLEKLREIGAMAKADVDVTSAQQKLVETRQRAAELKAAIESVGQQPVAVAVDSTQLVTLRERLAAAEKQATQLSGREYSRSGLNNAIDSEVAKLSEYSSAIERAKNVRASLATAASGPRGDSAAVAAKDKEIAALEQEQKAVADHLNQLRALRAQIKEIRRGITEAERAPTATDDAGRSNQFKELEAAQRAAARAAKELQQVFQQKYGINIDLAGLNALIERADNAGEVIGSLGKLIEKFGESEFTAAADQFRQMASATEAVLKPLAAAQATVAGLTAEVQGAFLPALASAQSEAESLVATIKEGASPATAIAAAFDRAKASADAATAATAKLKEVSDSVGRLKSGRELVFQQPQLVESLGSAAAVGTQAAELPASAIRANPRIAESLAEVAIRAKEAEVAYARLQAAADLPLFKAQAQTGLDEAIKKLDEARAKAANEIKVGVDISEADARLETLNKKIAAIRQDTEFQFTGRIQNIDQAKQEFARIRSEAAKTTGIGDMSESLFPIRALGDLVATEDASKLEEIIRLVDILKFRLGEQIAANVETKDAENDIKRLTASYDELKARAAQASTGLVQNRAQAEAALGGAVGRYGELEPARRQRLSGAMDAAVGSLDGGGFDAEAIRNFELLIAKEIEAQQGLQRLREEMGKIAEGSNPSQPIDRLKKNLEEARLAVAKLTGEQRKLGEQNIAKIEGFVGKYRGSGREEEAVDLAAQRAGELRDDARAAAPEKQVRNPLGEAFGTTARDIDNVQSKVISLQNNIENLPTPLQAEFIPAINRVRDAFAKLTPTSTKAEIDAAAEEARKLGVEVDRAGSAAKRFGTTFKDAFRESESKAAATKLQFLTNTLVTSGRSSAQAEKALERLRLAYDQVARSADGFSSAANRAKIAAAEQAAAASVATAAGKSAARLAEDMKRAGDVGRGGVDKWSLALNQAAFALDDLMSSTGGLEFKLRAISNNITQLAFVLGGTKGLFIGLGAVIAGTAAVQIVKWINGGRTAEDQTKALNESLSKQKTLVDELAQSFRSLGDSITRGTRSPGGQAASDLRKQIEDIRKKSKEAGEERILGASTPVQTERANQNRLQREIDAETNVGRRIALQRQAAESREAERRASAIVLSREAPGGADVSKLLRDSAELIAPRAEQARGQEPGANDLILRALPLFLQGQAAGVQGGGSQEAMRSQIDALSSAIEFLKPVATETLFGFSTGRAKDAAVLTEDWKIQLERIRAALDRSVNEDVIGAFKKLEDAAASLRSAQDEAAEAIKQGVPGARMFALELERNAQAVEDAAKNLEAAQESTGADRDVKIREAIAESERAAARRGQIAAQADGFRRERTVDPQRQTEARAERARDNLREAGLETGRIARRMRELENERETIRQAAQERGFADDPLAQRLFADREAAINAEIEATEGATLALKAFADGLERANSVVQSDMSAAQQDDAEARRAVLDAEGRAARVEDVDTGREEASRERTRKALEAQRGAARDAEVEIEKERAKNEERATQGKDLLDRKRAADERAEAGRAALEASAQIEEGFKGIGVDSVGMSYSDLEKKAREAGSDDLLELVDKSRAANAAAVAAGIGGGNDFWKNTDNAMKEAAALAEEAEKTFSDEFARMKEIDEQLAGGGVSAAEQGALREERAALEAKVQPEIEASERRLERATAQSESLRLKAESAARGEKLAYTDDEDFARETQIGIGDIRQYGEGGDAGQRARAIEAERRYRNQREKEARTATAAGRGREMFMNDRERFARDIRDDDGIVADMTAGAMDQAGLMNVQGRAELLRKGIQNQMESVAPMLQQFADARENALFQGPSRAALNVSDVSTSQGASELSRLIRGDDSAKDVNLAELRKQTQKFDELIKAVQAANPGVLL